MVTIQSLCQYITAGWTEYLSDRKIFASGIRLDNNLLDLSSVYLMIISGKDQLALKLRAKFLTQIQSVIVSPTNMRIESLQTPIVASGDDDTNIDFLMTGNVGAIDTVFAALFSLNKTATGTKPIYFYTIDSEERIKVTVNKSEDNDLHIHLNIATEYAKLGGVLSLQSETWKSSGLINRILRTRTYDVLSRDSGSVFPSGSISVLNMRNTTILSKPYQTLECSAHGNPPPNVGWFKEYGHGEVELVPDMDLILRDNYYAYKTYTIFADDPTVEGKYTQKKKLSQYRHCVQ